MEYVGPCAHLYNGLFLISREMGYLRAYLYNGLFRIPSWERDGLRRFAVTNHCVTYGHVSLDEFVRPSGLFLQTHAIAVLSSRWDFKFSTKRRPCFEDWTCGKAARRLSSAFWEQSPAVRTSWLTT